MSELRAMLDGIGVVAMIALVLVFAGNLLRNRRAETARVTAILRALPARRKALGARARARQRAWIPPGVRWVWDDADVVLLDDVLVVAWHASQALPMAVFHGRSFVPTDYRPVLVAPALNARPHMLDSAEVEGDALVVRVSPAGVSATELRLAIRLEDPEGWLRDLQSPPS